MKQLKLEIDLLPKGAWGNDLSVTLAKKDWDTLRNYCYQKANGTCQICGCETDKLQAHEVWDFNISAKTQTLKNILAICSKCHGVIHYRNSKRLGYGENAKRHFMQVNHVDEMTFNEHLTKAMTLYEKRNAVYHWHMVTDLSQFGVADIEIKSNYLPFVENPYTDDEIENLRKNTHDIPVVTAIDVDNYSGSITIKCERANKILWFADGQQIAMKYNFAGTLVSTLSVKNLLQSSLFFRLIGNNGEFNSKQFVLANS